MCDIIFDNIFVSLTAFKFVGVLSQHLRLSLEVFVKCLKTFVWPSDKFWSIFGNLRNVVGNLRKIAENVVVRILNKHAAFSSLVRLPDTSFFVHPLVFLPHRRSSPLCPFERRCNTGTKDILPDTLEHCLACSCSPSDQNLPLCACVRLNPDEFHRR